MQGAALTVGRVAQRRRSSKSAKPPERKRKTYSGFVEDGDCDNRCSVRRWAERLELIGSLDVLAFRAIAEHMTPAAWDNACAIAWQNGMIRVRMLDQNPSEPGDPPREEDAETNRSKN